MIMNWSIHNAIVDRYVLELILSGRSLIKSKKSNGPSIEPCRTPLTTGTLSDEQPSTISLWVLPRRKDDPTMGIPSDAIMMKLPE